MDRRAFLKAFGLAAATAAAATVIPDLLPTTKRSYFLSPPGGWTGKGVSDRISMRFVKEYHAEADRFPLKVDVLYGFATLQPELGVRVRSDEYDALIHAAARKLADDIDRKLMEGLFTPRMPQMVVQRFEMTRQEAEKTWNGIASIDPRNL